MGYSYVKRDESVLPKNLGKKGKNIDGIRFYISMAKICLL